MEFTNVVDCGEPHFSKTFYRLLGQGHRKERKLQMVLWETLDFSCPKQLKRHWVLRRGNLTCNVILEKRQFLHYCMQAPSQSCLLFIRSQNKHSKPIFLGKRDYCGKIGNLWLFAPLSSSSVVDVHLEIPLERSRREASLSQMTRAI